MLKLIILIIFPLNFSFLNASFLNEEDHQRTVSFSTFLVTNVIIKGIYDISYNISDLNGDDIEKNIDNQLVRRKNIQTTIVDLLKFNNGMFLKNLKDINIVDCHFEFGESLIHILATIKNISNINSINFSQTSFGDKAVDVLINQLQSFDTQVCFQNCHIEQDSKLRICQSLPHVIIL